MLQRAYAYVRRVFKVAEQTEKNTSELKEQQHTLNELTTIVQRLAFDQELQRKEELHEREKMVLRLENILLRERALPPGEPKNETSMDELRRLIADLRQDIEELRQRLEQVERHSKE